jgi:hypothetical protein
LYIYLPLALLLPPPRPLQFRSLQFTAAGAVDTTKLGEYLIEYDCSLTIDGVKYEALTKLRAIKVVDTKKPTCSVLHTTVTREASFPFNAEAAVCKDGFEGKVSRLY